jgi:hypothetical protein
MLGGGSPSASLFAMAALSDLLEIESLGAIAERPSHLLIRHGNRYFRIHRLIYEAVQIELGTAPLMGDSGARTPRVRELALDFVKDLRSHTEVSPRLTPVLSVDADRLVRATAWLIQPLFGWTYGRQLFVMLLLLATNSTIGAVWAPDPAGATHFPTSFSVVSAGMIAIAVGHELFHAAVALNLGCRAHRIGFGFYRILPVFYADVSDIWRLRSHDRIVVDAAGIFFQLLLGPILFVLSVMLDGSVGTALRHLFHANLFVIAINLIPFGRLDGYWIVSDLLDTAYLQRDAREEVKNWCRSVYSNAPAPLRLGLLGYGLASIAFTVLVIISMSAFAVHLVVQVVDRGGDATSLAWLVRQPFVWVVALFTGMKVAALARRFDTRAVASGNREET